LAHARLGQLGREAQVAAAKGDWEGAYQILLNGEGLVSEACKKGVDGRLVRETKDRAREAERRRPRLRVTSVLAGRDVKGARIFVNGREHGERTPAVLSVGRMGRMLSIGLSLEIGSASYRFAERGMSVDWEGVHTLRACLEETKAPEVAPLVKSVPSTPPHQGGWIVPGISLEFVWIAALGVWVGKYEVTNAQFRAFRPEHDSGKESERPLNGPRQPVVRVNLADAVDFAEWLTEREEAGGRLPEGCTYRLPTEKEWVTFARCGDGRTHPWGNTWPPTAGNFRDQALARESGRKHAINGYDDGFAASCPVESSGVSGWGLYGVGGNVWECTVVRKKLAVFTKMLPKTVVWHGAAWDSLGDKVLRCDSRLLSNASFSDFNCGFRLVLGK
jgi:formylglycine-generating enzyme